MKKTLKLLLIAAALMCLLTGCFKQETTIKLSSLGNAKVESSMIGTDQAFGLITGGQDRAELMDGLVSEINSAISEKGSKESVEQISETINGEEMNGVKYKADFKSLDEMFASEIFNYFNSNVPASLSSQKLQEGQSGISLRSVQHWFGTDYFIDGSLDISDERYQHELGMFSEDPTPDPTNAAVNMTFKLPFVSIAKANGKLKLFRHTFKFTATKDNPLVPLNIRAFAISVPMLIAALIILALLIMLLVFGTKIKKLTKKIAELQAPAVFEGISDAFENAKDTVSDFAAGVKEKAEEIVEDVKEKAENITEDIKDAAEDFVTPGAEEETENTDSGDNE
ncbi:MAG: YtxH domain-containing protein [Clostridia bacterium]|nr:YtxH domain-containing protein [Clostridia bacterium]